MTKAETQDWLLAPELEPLWDKLDERTPARRGLTVGAIVESAIALADAEGIDAVSMARIAKSLGFATMAIYRHIPNKATLVVLMIDRAIGRPPALDAGQSWRTSLTDIARSQADLYRQRPWLLTIPVSSPPATPNNLRWMNATLVALHDTPLAAPEKLQVLIMLTSLIRGLVQLNADGDDDEAIDASFRNAVDRLSQGSEFAETRRTFFDDVPAGAALEKEDTSELQFALDRLLDGLEVLFSRRRAEGWTTT